MSSSSQDIPTQKRLTQHLTKHWAPYKALRQRYAGTRFEEQRQLHLPQKQGHGPRLHSSSRDECARGASRQRQGPQSLLEVPFMARDRQAHIRQRCLPIQRSGRRLSPRRYVWVSQYFPPSPVSIIARLLNVAAKSTHWTCMANTIQRLQLPQVQPRRMIGGGRIGAVVPHGRTHGTHATWSDGKRRPTARRCGDSELP